MRINNNRSNPPPSEALSDLRRHDGLQSPAPSSQTQSTPQTSTELNQLVEKVRAAEEVRPEVVEAARAKIASGELLTRGAAEQTAAAFFRDQ